MLKLGYVWPIPVYKREKKADPKDLGHKVQTLFGRRVVILDGSHGTHLTVPGVEEYMRHKKVGAKMEVDIGNTDHAPGEDVDTSFKRACDTIAVKGQAGDGGEVFPSNVPLFVFQFFVYIFPKLEE